MTLPRPFALIVSDPDAPSDHEAAISLDELARLLGGLGVPIADRVVARRRRDGPRFPPGRIAELKERLEAIEDPVVVVDTELDPRAHRELERALEAEVLDRVAVVLRVFERRATTPLAIVELELARLRYDAPRLREGTSGDDRVGGGGRGGRGHTNVELARQRMTARRVQLESELPRLHRARDSQSARRRAVPTVALVGYTNAGKSSLLRALTGAEVLVQDALFATLESTVRALSPPTTPKVLVGDTVGFVRNLPHDLVASFRSTLEEACEADLRLVVVDASDPEHPAQLEVTRETLDAIGADGPSLIVLNKADRLDAGARATLAERHPDAVFASATARELDDLRARIEGFFDARAEADVLVVPFTEPALLAEIRGEARVLDERYDATGATLAIRAQPTALARWRGALGDRPLVATADAMVDAAEELGLSLVPDGPLDEGGLDFRVLHAADEDERPWILRAPRREDVVGAAQREARALRLVRARGVPAPEWRLHAREVIAYPRLDGAPVMTFGPDGLSWRFAPDAPPDAFVESVRSLLEAMRGVSIERAREANVPVTRIGAARSEARHAIEATKDALAPPEALLARWRRWVDEAPWPDAPGLVHGDLHPGHLLVDDAQRVVGVLDWTECRVTDPSIDLALLAGAFGRDALHRWTDDEALATHAWERWLAYPTAIAKWALDHEDAAALDHARALLGATPA